MNNITAFERITSKDNDKIKRYIKLAGQKSKRDESGLFVIESFKLVKEAVNENIKFETVFVTESCFNKSCEPLEKLFQTAKTYIINDDIDKKLSLSKSPCGIYAVCKKLDNSLNMCKIYTEGMYVCLADLQDTGNVGTIIRTAEALGANGVILTKGTCDIYSPKVLRSAMGSVFRLPFINEADILDLVENLNKNGCMTVASVVNSEAEDIRNVKQIYKNKRCRSLVLLIGNEGNGLSADVSDRCTLKATINMKGNAESLNAAMASGILMWELLYN